MIQILSEKDQRLLKICVVALLFLQRAIAASTQPYRRVVVGVACTYTFFAGTTFAFGAAAVVGGNIGINSASSSYGGPGLGAYDFVTVCMARVGLK